ncbi:hypothetical protein HAZT_HAZT002696 [Hyalella azteca]|uniref:Arginine and glutamate-rich protein 1 n=1 Tax=Hyalella azteca TaxID=294128 RepID=A0A6A0H336_HYAAZ|nr:hypothetical protein HAZT_HAZT002696 [Hyalella azteca]
MYSSRKIFKSDSSSSSSDEEIKSREKKIDEVDRLAELERIRRQREAEMKQVEELAARRVEELVAKRVEEELERRKDEIEAEVLRRVEEAKHLMEEQMLQELEKKRKEQEEEQHKREASSVEMREFNGSRCKPVPLQVFVEILHLKNIIIAHSFFFSVAVTSSIYYQSSDPLHFPTALEAEALQRAELERIMEENQRKIEEAQAKFAEQQLKMVEEQRAIEEERIKMKREQERRTKEEQKLILGKNNARPKISFSLS